MTTPAVAYPDWKAPAEDGKILVWPDPADILDDTRRNADRLSSESTIVVQNVPLAEVRRQQRQWLGVSDDQPIIATGHQTELYHAGVWAKIALIGQVAQKLDGQAYHFAVDTDQPKHLSLRWPGGSSPITDDPALTTAHWSGSLKSPTPHYLDAIERALRSDAAHWGFTPAAIEFLEMLKTSSPVSSGLSAAITSATQALDHSLGLEHRVALVSPMLAAPPYLLFVHHILSRASEFARHYNGALADYRRLNKIRGATRPMPDLAVSSETCEVPFWLDNMTTGGRDRAEVTVGPDGWSLHSPGGERFIFDPAADGWEAADKLAAFLQRSNLRLAPRALTLTLFFRLFLVDQFVHGIGGGRYDQVTDSLIAAHFGLAPPTFSVTTATLFFPTAVGRGRACLPCIAQEGHRLKHRLLGIEKMNLVAAIDTLPRKSSERQIAFGRMHGRLAAASVDNPVLRAWEERSRAAKAQSAEDQTVFDRELFYAIQPRERLMSVIEQYHAAFS